MRISDWSSDVCSSDLQGKGVMGCAAGAIAPGPGNLRSSRPYRTKPPRCTMAPRPGRSGTVQQDFGTTCRAICYRDGRSEEHTSELQSLMRISYAVFCLKKNNTTKTKQTTTMIN